MVTDFEKIAKRYIQGWFWPDFISLIPLQIAHHKFYLIKLTRLTRFPEFMEFFNISSMHQFLVKSTTDSSRSSQIETQFLLKYLYKMFKLISSNLIITYFLGLMFYIISDSLNDLGMDKTFIINYGFQEMTDFEIIVRCMYFMLTTITTTGFGDYIPLTNVERAYVIFVELIGVALYSYVMGNMLELISNYEKKVAVDDKSIELHHWLSLLDRFNTKKALSKPLIEEIEKHFKYFWKEYRTNNFDINDQTLASLPKNTRHYVFFDFIKICSL